MCWAALPGAHLFLAIPFLFWKKCFYTMIFISERLEMKYTPKLHLINNMLSSPRSNFSLNVFWWALNLQWPGAGAPGRSLGASGVGWLQRPENRVSHFTGIQLPTMVSVWFRMSLSCACRTSSLSLGFNGLLQQHYLSPL